MVFKTVQDLVDTLRHERLVEPSLLDGLTDRHLAEFDDPRDLAKYLIQLGWVTVYQINHLFEGRAQDLVLGSYVLLDLLGEGGVGEVYKAWDRRHGRYVALKVLRQHLASTSDAVKQFQRELAALTRLSHPNVIRTYDADKIDGSHCLAMELVEGTDLGKVVQLSGPLLVGEAADCIRQVASGLQHAHQFGLVHRDIKPANLFLIHPPGYETPTPGIAWRRPKDPEIKIIDWGLARLCNEANEETGPDCAPRSEEGMLIGTADYVAPEQSQDPSLVDVRADIYSLGCTFYYLLTGQPPFPGTSVMQKLLQHQQEEPTRIEVHRPDVPVELASIIHKMMAKDPDDRYHFPLAIMVPLRKFCASNSSYNGLTLRPTSGAKKSGASANGTSLRPSANGTSLRPSANGTALRPGTATATRGSSGAHRRPPI